VARDGNETVRRFRQSILNDRAEGSDRAQREPRLVELAMAGEHRGGHRDCRRKPPSLRRRLKRPVPWPICSGLSCAKAAAVIGTNKKPRAEPLEEPRERDVEEVHLGG